MDPPGRNSGKSKGQNPLRTPRTHPTPVPNPVARKLNHERDAPARRPANSASPTFPPLVMASLIEVPLNSFRYHFRRLTWQEEMGLSFAKADDQRKVILAKAPVDVSGLPVTSVEALKILKAIPEAIFWRIWLVYRGNLPPERYYTSGGLYETPDPMTYRAKIDSVPGSGMIHQSCRDLAEAVRRIEPKLHVFGHVHGAHGMFTTEHTTHVNAVLMWITSTSRVMHPLALAWLLWQKRPPKANKALHAFLYAASCPGRGVRGIAGLRI